MFESSPWELIYLLLIMAGVVALAFFASKWLGKRFAGKGTSSGKLVVLDRLVLGQDKALLVVKAGSKTMLLGATQHHIDKLCDLDTDEFTVMASPATGSAFSDVFRSTLKDNWGISLGGKGSSSKEKADGEVEQHFDDNKEV